MNIKPGRKGEIINAALKIMEQHGNQNLTMKKIACEVGITEPGLYRHFKNKKELVAAIHANLNESAARTLLSIREIEGGALDKIGSLFLTSLRRIRINPSITEALFPDMILNNSGKVSRKAFSIMEMTRESVEALILEGKKNREIPGTSPETDLSLIVMGAFRLLVTRWRLSGRAFGLEEEGRALWRTLEALLSGQKNTARQRRIAV